MTKYFVSRFLIIDSSELSAFDFMLKSEWFQFDSIPETVLIGSVILFFSFPHSRLQSGGAAVIMVPS